MAITRIKNSTIGNKTPKYNDVLAGLPFRPIIGTASDGGNGISASVAFTGNNVANGTITYTALSSPGSFTGTGTTSPVTVSGLTAGTAYTFQVKAGNSLGDSAYSAASNSVTPVQPPAFESIATATGSGATSITFNSIPSTYAHLQLRMLIRSTGTGDGRDLNLTVNGAASAGDYKSHYLLGNGSTVGSGVDVNGSTANIWVGNPPASATAANIFAVSIVDILDYANTNKNKTIRALAGVDTNAGVYQNVCLLSGVRLSTAAISSVTLTLSNGNFATGSSVALYGIKGA